jgi:glycosyltransferase involved in cell wall biosynthesis
MFFLIVFCVVFLIQLFYYGYFFAPYAFFKQKPAQVNSQPVSIIICAKNEEENLRHLFPCLLDQNYPEYEIVLVDDASFDGTLELMKSFKDQCSLSNISVQIISVSTEHTKGKKFALTQGVLAAKNELLLLTDADCKPVSNKWIQQMTKGFSNDVSLILGYGAYQKIKGSYVNKLIRFETLLTAIQYFSYATYGKAYMGVGRNLAYKKEDFLRVNGFESHDHVKSGDDDLFVSQIATPLNTGFCDEVSSHTISEPETSFTNWIRQKRRHLTTSSFYSSFHKLTLGLFYVSQLAFYLLTFFALVYGIHLYAIITLFIVRFVIWYLILIKSSVRLNEKDLICLGPLYEISIIFIQLYIFLRNLVSPPKFW